MSFIEILVSAITIDLEFFIDLVMNNLFWVFGFIVAGYFFSNHSIKGMLISGVIFSALVLVSADLFFLINFSIYTAYGLMILYLIRVVALLFLENTEGGSRLIPPIWVLTFFITIAIIAYGVV